MGTNKQTTCEYTSLILLTSSYIATQITLLSFFPESERLYILDK